MEGDGPSAFVPSLSAPLRPSLFRSQGSSLDTKASSATLRSFCSLSIVKRSKEFWSRDLTFDASCTATTSGNPLLILKSLLDLLHTNRIHGPTLVRLKTEFNHILGRGGTFEVFGPSDSLDALLWTLSKALNGLEGCRSKRFDLQQILTKSRKDTEFLRNVAIKRAYIYQGRSASATNDLSVETSTRAFGQQVTCAYREIEALCLPALRDHPNIVQLRGWGLCLDSLESHQLQDLVIPLLLLERAHCSLAAYIKQVASEVAIDCIQCTSICRDIGAALETIHAADLVHGDLKLDNVLLFPATDPDSQVRWRAKVCDFGLATTENPPDAKVDHYHGTPGWLPVKSGARFTKTQLQPCDIYSYGLIVWFLFTGRWRSPMPLDDSLREDPHSPYSDEMIFSTAASEVSSSCRGSPERSRILAVIRASLHNDVQFWETQPWIYWDVKRYRTVGKVVSNPTILMKCSTAIRHTRSRIKHCLLHLHQLKLILVEVSKVICLLGILLIKRILDCGWFFRNAYASATYSITFKPFLGLARKEDGYEKILEDEAVWLSGILKRRIDPKSKVKLHHGVFQCHDMFPLFGRLYQRIVRGAPDSRRKHELRALGFLRSLFPYCCWSILRYNGFNVLDRALRLDVPPAAIESLCDGEIGESEVRHLDIPKQWQWIFRGVSNSPPELNHRYRILDVKELTSRLCPLIERGLRIDLPVVNNGSSMSLFRALLEHKPHDMAESLRVYPLELTKALAVLNRRTDIPQPLRYFVNGESLPDHIGDLETREEYSTTSLHESVFALSYVAVEEILFSGFNVNARNKEGKTPTELAFNRWCQTRESQRRQYEPSAERIFRLLSQTDPERWMLDDQNFSVINSFRVAEGWYSQDEATADISLAPGWERLVLSTSIPPIFREVHTGSITLIHPGFNLFSDQRLALGYRKASTMSGQVYHLDLYRFLKPSTPKLDRIESHEPESVDMLPPMDELSEQTPLLSSSQRQSFHHEFVNGRIFVSIFTTCLPSLFRWLLHAAKIIKRMPPSRMVGFIFTTSFVVWTASYCIKHLLNPFRHRH